MNAAGALEDHPDNVAAALLGGLTVSCRMSDRSVFAVPLRWPENLRFVVLTPAYALPTPASRKVLPHSVSREDAVFNLQRLALLLSAVQTGKFTLLREALRDRLHQPFRHKLAPGLESALALEGPDLLGVFLSGAGPSIVAVAERNFDAVEDLLQSAFRPVSSSFTLRRLKVHQPAIS